VIRRNEPVATNELFTDTPAIGCGVTTYQIFVGMITDVVDIFPLQMSKQFFDTLEDNVRFRGSPTKLVSDQAQVEISGRALEFLRVYGIPSWQSEPHQHHQNYAEQKIQHIKQMANTIMDRTGAPPKVWLFCLMYLTYVLDHTWNENIKNVPLTALLGVTVDTSNPATAFLAAGLLQGNRSWCSVGFEREAGTHFGHIGTCWACAHVEFS
jgi:hypothetical protein